ncbi:MAG: bifunctional 2-polyprenyl-6-hydroxyphenol methylase/3-demethylubiquinol 3-O-methyltransferase UbiG [Lysobacteraceae bacterium]
MNTTHANFDQAELDKFGDLAHRWWDPSGPQRALHELNPTRLAYVRSRVALRGASVLDVGCGAGLLSEVLAGEGAAVTALDLAPELIEIAKLHLLETQVMQPALRVDYRLQSVEALAVEPPSQPSPANGGSRPAMQFDAITCMEMLEHVPDPSSIVRSCASLLKPGGRLFVSTLNRTPAAFALAIVGAEYVARLLPKGTHSYAQFIRPSELALWLREAGLQLEDVSGVHYNPLTRRASLGRRTDVNYLACAVKPA